MISVIVPIYNVEDYIEECIASLVSQTDPDFEVIFVNDGSTDLSLDRAKISAAALKQYKFIDQTNGGLSVARNTGLAHVSNDYVMFLDSDDFLRTDSIEVLKSAIQKHNSDLVLFSAASFGEGVDAREVQRLDDMYCRHSSLFAKNISGVEFLSQALSQHVGYIKSACLYVFNRTSAPELRFIPGIIHEDNHFTALITLASRRVVSLNEQLYCRRVRPGSIMSTTISDKNVNGYLESSKAIFRELQNSNDRTRRKTIELLTADCLWQAFTSALKLPSHNESIRWVSQVKHSGLSELIKHWNLKHRLFWHLPPLARLGMKLRSRKQV